MDGPLRGGPVQNHKPHSETNRRGFRGRAN
jgi:hypothetical protein